MSGFITALAGSSPAYDTALSSQLHPIMMGLCGLPGELVRPSWQRNALAQPPADTDWLAYAVFAAPITEYHALVQLAQPIGAAEGTGLQREELHEKLEILASFYGPNSNANAAAMRSALFLPDNRDIIKNAGFNFIGVERMVRLPVLVNTIWIGRTDLPITFRRKIAPIYPVTYLDPTGSAEAVEIITEVE